MDALEKFLDPAYNKSTSRLTQDAKEDLLLGYTGKVEAVSRQVDQLQSLKDYVNTTEFQGLDAHERKLAAVAHTHGQQEQAVEEASCQARELMKTYNQIMLQLSAQCIEWDRELARLEAQK